MSLEPDPFSTGGGGTAFEWLVATYYVVSLVCGRTARGLPGTGTVVEVRLQQRRRGYPVDDIVVLTEGGTARAQLILQAKHNLTFTANNLFCETILDCWNQFHAKTFRRNNDRVGIAIAETCYIRKIREHFQKLLAWARTNNQAGFYELAAKFKTTQTPLDVFKDSLARALGRQPAESQLWQFLRHLVILSFDVETLGGRDSLVCRNELQAACRNDVPRSQAIFHGIFELVSRYSTNGGIIDAPTLQQELPEILPLEAYLNSATVNALLKKQVNNQLTKEKQSKKYIPDVFTEIRRVKESLRFVAHPLLFLHKRLEEFNRLDFSFLNRTLSRVGLPSFPCALPHEFSFPTNIAALPRQLDILQAHALAVQELLDQAKRDPHSSLADRVPQEAAYVFKESRFLLDHGAWSIDWQVRQLHDYLIAGRTRIFILTSRAGQGKTNFVCDFSERFLLPHDIPSMLVTGRDLRNVPATMLSARLVELAMGQEFRGSLTDFLSLVAGICEERNTPFVIIIDGINEHPQINLFSDALESLLATLVAFPFMRIILTCRSEYYRDRFHNLTQASFTSYLLHLPEINRDMSAWERRHMIRVYFRHFRILPGFMSGRVRETLGGDPLLLRFFCEAYGNPASHKDIQLDSMPDIYRPVIFERYLEKKLEEVTQRTQSTTRLPIGLCRPYMDLLNDLLQLMVSRRQFSDISISDLDRNHVNALSELIDEDLFLRKDLLDGKGVLSPGREVINFTFDEFRDFLLATYLVDTFRGSVSEEDFRSLVLELTEKRSTTAEGLSRYLFHIAREKGEAKLLALLESMPWYDEVFFECIFAVQDSLIKDSDVKRLKQQFLRDRETTKLLIYRLLERPADKFTPRLNSDLLFEMMEGLTDDEYNQSIAPLFQERYAYGHTSEITGLVADIRETVNPEGSRWDLGYERLMEFLIFLFPIRDTHELPAFKLFRKFAEQNPARGIALLKGHLDTEVSEIRARIWEMLAELAIFGIFMPESIVQVACTRFSQVSLPISREAREIDRFIKLVRAGSP